MQLFHCSLECFSAVCVLAFLSHFSNHLVFPPSICLPLSHAELLSVPRPVCVSKKLNSFRFGGHYFHDIWPASQSVLPFFMVNPSLSLMQFFCYISRKVSCPSGEIQIQTQTVLHLAFELFLYTLKMQLVKALHICSFCCMKSSYESGSCFYSSALNPKIFL